MRRFTLVDKTILVYELLLSVHILFSISRLPDWGSHLLANISVVAWIAVLVRMDDRLQRPWTGFLHTFYPLFLLAWLYPQACLLRHTVISQDLDPLLLQWELILFQKEWYRILPLSMGQVGLEIFHGLYFSYYLGLGLFAMLAYKHQRPQVRTYLFILLLTVLVNNGFVILFPASGPVPLRATLMPEGVFFIPIMDWIYGTFDRGGGAFPSQHAAAVVIVSIFANAFFPKWKIPILVFFFGVLTATVVCAYHYAIDTVLGVISGLICYLAGMKLNSYLSGDA